MKTYKVTYTEDIGNTYYTVTINANNVTEAYINVALQISIDGAITDLIEVEG